MMILHKNNVQYSIPKMKCYINASAAAPRTGHVRRRQKCTRRLNVSDEGSARRGRRSVCLGPRGTKGKVTYYLCKESRRSRTQILV